MSPCAAPEADESDAVSDDDPELDEASSELDGDMMMVGLRFWHRLCRSGGLREWPGVVEESTEEYVRCRRELGSLRIQHGKE